MKISDQTCLFIIDVQKGFINEHTAHIPSIVENLQKNYARVFVSQFINAPASPFRCFMKWERFDKNENSETDLAFTPVSQAILFEKNAYSAFVPAIENQLVESSICDIHLCGIDTDCCILKTAVDAFEKGYRPVVLSDACASHAGEEYHEAGLKILKRLIGAEQIQKTLR